MERKSTDIVITKMKNSNDKISVSGLYATLHPFGQASY